MALEENKAIVRRIVETMNKQNLASLDNLIAPDCVNHTFKLRGLEDFKQFITVLFTGFPDFHMTRAFGEFLDDL